MSLYDASNNYRGVTTAGAGGAFAFTDVAVGSYTLFFSDPQGGYFDEYWGDSVDFAGATFVEVTGGGTATVAANLDSTSFAQLSGVVTDLTGAPSRGITVVVENLDGSSHTSGDTQARPAATSSAFSRGRTG